MKPTNKLSGAFCKFFSCVLNKMPPISKSTIIGTLFIIFWMLIFYKIMFCQRRIFADQENKEAREFFIRGGTKGSTCFVLEIRLKKWEGLAFNRAATKFFFHFQKNFVEFKKFS